MVMWTYAMRRTMKTNPRGIQRLPWGTVIDRHLTSGVPREQPYGTTNENYVSLPITLTPKMNWMAHCSTSTVPPLTVLLALASDQLREPQEILSPVLHPMGVPLPGKYTRSRNPCPRVTYANIGAYQTYENPKFS